MKKVALTIAMLAPALGAGAAPAPKAAAVEPTPFKAAYAHNLAATNGVLRANPVGLFFDGTADELFVSVDGEIAIYNRRGMETFRFAPDAELGPVGAVATLENGDVVALSYPGVGWRLTRCDYRGAPIEPIEVKGLDPAIAAEFSPGNLGVAQGNLYLLDRAGMWAVVADAGGNVLRVHDLGALTGVEPEKRAGAGIRGISVDAAGRVLFTIPAMFKAFVVAPDGSVRGFGSQGSTPGKFNVIAGIAGDEQGNVYVTDMLRSVVMAFDEDLGFLREFGYRGYGPGRLIAPHELAAGGGKIFVSQMGKRGVSVFEVASGEVAAR